MKKEKSSKKSDKTYNEFNKILEDIKSVKIQGAENIARHSIKAYLLNPKKSSAKKILKTRPTEPLMQNAIKFLLKFKDSRNSSEKFLKDLERSHEKIEKSGSRLIKNGMNIYVHCHSSTVIDILKYAKLNQKKDFVVYTSEVEPLLQGRKTALDLAKLKIKTIISPDLAIEQSIKNCDLFLFGVDAFTKKTVANKIGTSTLCKLAKYYNVPRYSCGVSLKFTKRLKIEFRSGKEVWNNNNKWINIFNPSFDKTSYKDITGIISEFGILPPKEFVKKAKEKLRKLNS